MTLHKDCPHCEGTGKVIDHKVLGEASKLRRELYKIVLRELAKKMGISVGYLSDLEHGRKKWNSDLIKNFDRSIQALVAEQRRNLINSQNFIKP